MEQDITIDELISLSELEEFDAAARIHTFNALTAKKMSAKQKEYQAFFRKKLKAWNVSSPSDLSESDKKKFFSEVKREWKGGE